MSELKFFDPVRWEIVPASDYAIGPSNGNPCHTLNEAMKIFQAELPARVSNAMRRQKELEDLKLFATGQKSAMVLKQTAAVSSVQNEIATLIGLLREYETQMVNSIKSQCAEFQASLADRSLVVDDTSKKISSCISKMSVAEDMSNNNSSSSNNNNISREQQQLDAKQMETVLSGMITADHLITESAALFSNFPQDHDFKIDRMKDSTTLCPKLVTLSTEKRELKGVPPLIITKDIAVASSGSGGGVSGGEDGSGGELSLTNSPRGGIDSGIRRLIQVPGSDHIEGMYPRTAFGTNLTKRPMKDLAEYHKLLHAGCLRTLGAQMGAVSVNRSEFISPLTDMPLKPGRDTYRIFTLCTATPAEGKILNLCQNFHHLPKEAQGVTTLDNFRTVSQNFPILWFDFGSSTSVRIERYVLFHGHETQHCAMRSWRVLGTNDLPYPPGLVASQQDDTLLKIARDNRAAVEARHDNESENPDAVIPDSVNITVLDNRSREAVLGVSPYSGALFECGGATVASSHDASSPNNAAANANANNASSSSSSPSPARSVVHGQSPHAKHQRDFFRYIGIQVTAPGAGGGYHFELGGLEFYGAIMTLSN